MTKRIDIAKACIVAVSMVVLPAQYADANQTADSGTSTEEAIVPTPERRMGTVPSKVMAELGAGILNYNGDLADNIGVGGQTDLRLSARNNKTLGVEGAYSWGINDLEGTDPQTGGTLDGTAMTMSGDALAKVNVLKEGRLRPFAVVGLGLINLSVRDEESTSEDGTTITIPFGAGVQYLVNERWVVGSRFNYRVLTDALDNDLPSGDNWNLGLNVGARLF